MLEDAKNVAILLGFATFCFTTYDRFIAGRPLVSLAAPETLGGRRPFIVVRNIGKRDLLIREVSVYPTEVFWVAKSDSLPDIVSGALGMNQYIILPAGEELVMLLVVRENQLRNFENLRDRLRVNVDWRKIQSSWLPQIKSSMIIPALELRRIFGDSNYYPKSDS